MHLATRLLICCAKKHFPQHGDAQSMDLRVIGIRDCPAQTLHGSIVCDTIMDWRRNPVIARTQSIDPDNPVR